MPLTVKECYCTACSTWSCRWRIVALAVQSQQGMECAYGRQGVLCGGSPGQSGKQGSCGRDGNTWASFSFSPGLRQKGHAALCCNTACVHMLRCDGLPPAHSLTKQTQCHPLSTYRTIAMTARPQSGTSSQPPAGQRDKYYFVRADTGKLRETSNSRSTAQ